MIKSFPVFIEINAGSSTKYEVDEKTGKLVVDRFLRKPFVYPFDYGFVEGSRARDGDPLDAVVLSSDKLMPGTRIMCHAIGVLEMCDQAGNDPKVIAVPQPDIDPVYGKYKTIKDVPTEIIRSIKYFFKNYKTADPGKWSRIGKLKGKKTATLLVEKSLE